MAKRSWADERDRRRRCQGVSEADEKLRIIHSQVADATDKDGWCYVYDYEQGRYRYVHWIDAADLLMQHRATLADRPTVGRLEILQ